MKQIHYSVSISNNKTAKQQALDVIGKLKAIMPIERINMLIRVVAPMASQEIIRLMLHEISSNNTHRHDTQKQKHTFGISTCVIVKEGEFGRTEYTWEVRIDPELYKKITDAVSTLTKKKGRVEVLSLKEIGTIVETNTASKNEASSSCSEEVSRQFQNIHIGEPSPIESGRTNDPGPLGDANDDSCVANVNNVSDTSSVSDVNSITESESDSSGEEEVSVDLPVISRKNRKNKKNKKALGSNFEDGISKSQTDTTPSVVKGGKKGKRARRAEKQQHEERMYVQLKQEEVHIDL